MKIAVKRLLRAYHKNKQVLKEKRWGTEFLKVIIYSVTRSMEFKTSNTVRIIKRHQNFIVKDFSSP